MQDIKFEDQRQGIELVPQSGKTGIAEFGGNDGEIEIRTGPGLAFGTRTIDQHFFDFRVMAEDFCQRCVVMLG